MLKALRTASGLTQGQASKAIGISQSLIAKWESGVRIPRVKVLPRIAKAYNCSIEEVIDSLINKGGNDDKYSGI